MRLLHLEEIHIIFEVPLLKVLKGPFLIDENSLNMEESAEFQPSDPVTSTTNTAIAKWQNKLLPLMRGMIIFLTIFFFAASFWQLNYLQNQIANSPTFDLGPQIEQLKKQHSIDPKEANHALILSSYLLLEKNTMEKRHHQANVLLMSSIWIRYLGFVTGMIISLVGAAFILGKLKEDSSTISAKTASFEGTLKTASPGILLSVLGVTLMITTMVTRFDLGVTDNAVYLYKLDGQIRTSDTIGNIIPDLSKYTDPEKTNTK